MCPIAAITPTRDGDYWDREKGLLDVAPSSKLWEFRL